MFPQEERLFMVKSIRYVKDAFINAGSGVIDYLPTLDLVRPDIFVVNAEAAVTKSAASARSGGSSTLNCSVLLTKPAGQKFILPEGRSRSRPGKEGGRRHPYPNRHCRHLD